MDQVIQIIGAVVILGAFAALQFGLTGSQSRAYLVVNLLGSALLAVLAWDERQWGFLLLEAVWAAVSLWSLQQVMRGRVPDAGR